MSIAMSETMTTLCGLVVGLPIGTDLALLHFIMWMQLSGTFLSSQDDRAFGPGLTIELCLVQW